MGYGTKFKLKGDLDREFKSSRYMNLKQSEIDAMETLLVAQCMCEDNYKCDHYLEAEKRIENTLRVYVSYLEEKWKRDFEDSLSEDKVVYLCGWEYSRGRHEVAWSSADDIVSFYLRELFLLAIIKTQDPLEKDSNYYIKRQKIFDMLADLPWNVNDMWVHKFIDRYRDSDDAEEDGDDTPRNENEDETIQDE